jgi:SAM-dependent methyltransferase
VNIQKLFKIGMKREIKELLPNEGYQLELGPGFNPLIDENIVYLDLPEWNADIDAIPYDNCTFDVVHAYHFLEHVNSPESVLREIQRVLKHSGHVNIVVPHYKSDLAFEDLDHKHYFTEESWRKLMANNGYDKHNAGWELSVHANFIMAVDYRNLSIFTQLVKS